MSRRLLVIAFAIVLAGEASPLFISPDFHCACVTHTACCRLNMCLLKGRQESDGTRIQSCNTRTDNVTIAPSFLQWREMSPVLATVAPTPVPAVAAFESSLHMLDGIRTVDERPPRFFLIAA